MHRSEPSRLQSLALQLTDKVNNFVDSNERIFEMKQGNFFIRGTNQVISMAISVELFSSPSYRYRARSAAIGRTTGAASRSSGTGSVEIVAAIIDNLFCINLYLRE